MPGDPLIEDLLANPFDWDFDPQQRAYRRHSDNALVTEQAYRQYKRFGSRQKNYLTTPPPDHTTVLWRSHKRFTYVAIWVSATATWYISGTGQQYGGNEHSDTAFRAILLDEHTDGVAIVKLWDDLEV